MMCPTCGQVLYRVGDGYSTLAGVVPFHDAQGRMHVHENNQVLYGLACEGGHSFDWTGSPVCWCGHNQDTWKLEPAHFDYATTLALEKLLHVIGQFGQ